MKEKKRWWKKRKKKRKKEKKGKKQRKSTEMHNQDYHQDEMGQQVSRSIENSGHPHP